MTYGKFILASLSLLAMGAGGVSDTERVHRAILKLPAPLEREGWEETEQQRRQRLSTIAKANVAAAKKVSQDGPLNTRWLLVMNVATQWFETRFSHEVHAGGRGRWGSDDGKAKCLNQLHQNRLLPKERWEELGGTDYASTLACSTEGMLALQRAAAMCGWDGSDKAVARTLYAYGSGKGCDHTRAPKWMRLRARIGFTSRLRKVL